MFCINKLDIIKLSSSRTINLDKINYLIIEDRIKTVLQRFKPISRTVLISEQLNLLYRIQHKDTARRHRGVKLFH